MERSFLSKIRGRLDLLAIMVIIVTLAGFVLTLLKTPRYSSQAKVLVIQEHANIDAFTAAKSVEFVTTVLNEAIYSNSFIEETIKNNPGLAASLPTDAEARTKAWAKMVHSTVKTDTGTITLTVLNPSAQTAQDFTKTIVTTMITNGDEYHGGSNITIRLIDGPITSSKPSDPNITTNTLLALIVGLIAGVATTLLLPEKKVKPEIAYTLPEAGPMQYMASRVESVPDAAPEMPVQQAASEMPASEAVTETPTAEVTEPEITDAEAVLLTEEFADEVPKAAPLEDQNFKETPEQHDQRQAVEEKIQRWVKTGKFE